MEGKVEDGGRVKTRSAEWKGESAKSGNTHFLSVVIALCSVCMGPIPYIPFITIQFIFFCYLFHWNMPN